MHSKASVIIGVVLFIVVNAIMGFQRGGFAIGGEIVFLALPAFEVIVRCIYRTEKHIRLDNGR